VSSPAPRTRPRPRLPLPHRLQRRTQPHELRIIEGLEPYRLLVAQHVEHRRQLAHVKEHPHPEIRRDFRRRQRIEFAVELDDPDRLRVVEQGDGGDGVILVDAVSRRPEVVRVALDLDVGGHGARVKDGSLQLANAPACRPGGAKAVR